MEERDLPPPPTSDTNPKNLPPTQNNAQPSSESSRPNFQSGTYVVQIPKDQIYRIPPPEHALIVEQHRNLPKDKSSSRSRLICIFFLVIVIVVILCIIGGITSIFVKHKKPKFDIEGVVTKYTPHQKHPEYDIKLKAKNPNDQTSFSYDQDGDASLSFKGKEIAQGKCPSFDQGTKKSNDFKMILKSTNIVLPKEIEKSLKGKDSKATISLSLSLNAHLKLKVWGLNRGEKKVVVRCNLKLNILPKNTQIISQECQTNW
ncbi:hypothetical protein LguiA_004164 [Lonicera macranthoides]